MAFCLAQIENGDRVVLDKAVLLVGRHPDCDLVLEDSRKVSRRHCCIAQVNDVFVIRDLGSMNGVRINGVRIHEETALEVGDEVAFGDLRYVLESRDPSDAHSAEEPRETSPNNGAAEPAAKVQIEPKLPVDLSQKFPVPIDDEEGEEFAVEPSLALPEGISPVFDDNAEFPVIEDDPDNDDAVLLEDSGEQRDPGSRV